MNSSKVAFVGIDGGCWYILRRLMNERYMPNLKKLSESGVSGVLESLIPPVTGGVWLSIATGLNPSKTGVLDFFKFIDNKLVGVNSEDYRGRSFWDYAGIHNYHVCVIDWPTLYPAYPINGFMISSWLGLSTYPLELQERVLEVAGGEYNILINYHDEVYDDIELFLEDVQGVLEKKLRVSKWLLTSKDWNLFVDIFSYTDWLQHRMWHFVDPTHPLYHKELSKCYYRKFAELWIPLDEYLGEIMSYADKIFIVSDHGFGSNTCIFSINRWLEEKGYLVRQRLSPSTRLLELVLKLLKKTKLSKLIPERLKALPIVKSVLSKRYTYDPLYDIDVEKSYAYDPGYTIVFGGIHINKNNSYKRMLEKLLKDIMEIEKTYSVKVNVWLTKEIYGDSVAGSLPDIIITINNWACSILKGVNEHEVFALRPYSKRHTGSHRLRGIFIAWGNDIKKGVYLSKISVLDIAPTILYAMNLPIPENLDGKPVTRIFTANRSIQYVKPNYYKLKLSIWDTKVKLGKFTP